MSDDIIFGTVGEKSQALFDAIKAEEKVMVFCPYPIGWLAGVPASTVSIPLERLDDVEVSRSSITNTLSFKVTKDD